MAPYTLTPRNLQIRDNFDAIAPRYDLTNRVISLGIDLRWRRVAVRRLREIPAGGIVLDLACGTCDMALEVFRQRRAARIVGADLSRTMLALARKKIERTVNARGAPAVARGRVDLVGAPAEALPFKDGAFDAVTIAFGIRNVPDHRAGLKEMARVLRRGGCVCILEFSTPPSRFLWRIYNYYFFNVLPRIGGFLTGREAAYRYLTDSVALFPGADGLAADMEQSGFTGVSYVSMNGGIVCVHSGVKA
jgi:demethylmenaquinone methyltransferase/2-methoxy-6-polyprenyl-1,4-benzoquinol methylase